MNSFNFDRKYHLLFNNLFILSWLVKRFVQFVYILIMMIEISLWPWFMDMWQISDKGNKNSQTAVRNGPF